MSKKTTESSASLSPLEQLRPALNALQASLLRAAPGPLRATAVAALALVDHARAAHRVALLSKLDRVFFDPAAITRLELAARALVELATAEEQAEAQATNAKVRVEVSDPANALKSRLQRVLEYQLTDDASVAELAAIRPGNGYYDLASDLDRLAALAIAHLSLLSGDRHFDPSDPAEAKRLSAEIMKDLQATVGASAPVLYDRARVVTLLATDYAEVLEVLNFIGRGEPKEERAKRQALRTAVNGPARRGPKKVEPVIPD